MRRILALGMLLAVGVIAFGQSLGDAARQARAQEKARPKAATKVIANEDIPESPQASPAPATTDSKSDPAVASSGAPATKSSREWRKIIATQMDDIEALQAQINRLKDSVHFVTANTYVNGAEYNQYQVRKQQEVKSLEKQLEERNQKLAETQEAAKKEGMGDAVYEP